MARTLVVDPNVPLVAVDVDVFNWRSSPRPMRPGNGEGAMPPTDLPVLWWPKQERRGSPDQSAAPNPFASLLTSELGSIGCLMATVTWQKAGRQSAYVLVEARWRAFPGFTRHPGCQHYTSAGK